MGFVVEFFDTLHGRLVARQSLAELERKRDKAITRSRIWTQEEIDYAMKYGDEMSKKITWE